MTLLVFYAVLAIGVSFLCSLLEASLLSMPRSHVETLRERGTPTGRLLHRLKTEIDRPLAAILTLNTVAHTVGAAGVGAQAARIYGSNAVGIAGAVMTLLILIASEIIPKTVGAVYARPLAPITAWVTQAMIVLCFPLVWALERINRLFGGARQRASISRSELAVMLRLGHEGGSLQQREYEVASNLFALRDVPLSEILTPRTVIKALPESLTVAQALEEHGPLRFSRIPIHSGSIDQTTGYVHRYELHEALGAGRGSATLSDLGKPITVLPEKSSVARALDLMLQDHSQIALVVDEYGSIEGLLTLEDALESLLGREIVDETDPAIDMREEARKKRQRRPNEGSSEG